VIPHPVSWLMITLFFLQGPLALSFPRNWKYSQIRHVTRCFDTSKVKAWCDGDSSSLELNIVAQDGAGRNCTYSYGRMISKEVCMEHLQRIRTLMKDSKEVCVTGMEWEEGKKEAYYRFVAVEGNHGSVVW